MKDTSDRPLADVWENSMLKSFVDRAISGKGSAVGSHLRSSSVWRVWNGCVESLQVDWEAARDNAWLFAQWESARSRQALERVDPRKPMEMVGAALNRSRIRSQWRAATSRDILARIGSHDVFSASGLAPSAGSVLAVLIVALLAVLVGFVSFGVGVMIAVTVIPVPILVDKYRETNDLLSPLFLFSGFFAVFFYLPYLNVVVLRHRVYPFENPVYVAHLTMLFLFVGYLGYVVGYYNDTGQNLAERLLAVLPSQPPVPPQIGTIISVIIYAFGLVSLAVFVLLAGGPDAVLSASNWGKVVNPGNKLFWMGLNAGLFSGCAMYLAARKSVTKGGVVVALLTVSIFAALHSRKRIGGIIIVFVLLYHYRNRQVRVLSLASLGLAGFAVIGLFKPIEFLIQGKGLAAAASSIDGRYINRFIYSTLFQTHMGQVNGVPSEVPYQLGRTLPNNLVPYFVRDFPIVREVYAHPSSAARISVIVTVGLGTWENKGLVPGLFGELYINYGLVGIALGGLLMGYFSRWAYTLRPDQNESLWLKAAYPLFMYFVIASMFKTVNFYEHLRIMSPILVVALLRAKYYSGQT